MSQESFPFSVEPWSVVNENKEYQTPIFNLLSRTCRLEKEDHQGEFYILDTPEWINVIALTPEREVLLVEQYRFGIQEPTLEIPGGMVDHPETPREAARRELLEETGYISENWIEMGKVSANPAIQNNYTHLYLAKNCQFKGAENPDIHERIRVHSIPLDSFYRFVGKGVIHHSIVVAAAAKLMLFEREK